MAQQNDRQTLAEPTAQPSPLNVGFLMDQVAGHITNYRNLRSVTDGDVSIEADWCEVHYYRAGGAIERVRERFLPFVPTYLTGNARGAFELRQGLRRRTHDVIFTNTSVAILFSRRFARTPTMYDFDSTPKQLDDMAAYTLKRDPKPIEKLKRCLMTRLFHSATLLQAWSRWAKQSAIDDYGIDEAKIIINPPGVDLDIWRPPAQQPDHTARPRRVLFVGNDFERKGGDLLLEWYRTQRPDEVELHLVTREPVASGPGIAVYHDLPPNGADLVHLYGSCDVFVLPSRGECFGIATVEAMATGLPVIASDVGGTADIVEPGRNGFIVGAGRADELSTALASILADEPRRLAMGRQSRILAEQRFDLETNGRRTLRELKRIALPRSNPHAA